MPLITIRHAKNTDIGQVRDLLVRTWHATYDSMYGAEKVTEITDRWHSIENLTGQLEAAKGNSDATIFLVTELDRTIIGTSFATGDTAGIVRLSRLYILPEFQGAGVGKSLLLSTLAPFTMATKATLEVEIKNLSTIAFYQRYGFRTTSSGSACGGDQTAAMPHLVMEAKLPLMIR